MFFDDFLLSVCLSGEKIERKKHRLYGCARSATLDYRLAESLTIWMDAADRTLEIQYAGRLWVTSCCCCQTHLLTHRINPAAMTKCQFIGLSLSRPRSVASELPSPPAQITSQCFSFGLCVRVYITTPAPRSEAEVIRLQLDQHHHQRWTDSEFRFQCARGFKKTEQRDGEKTTILKIEK